MLFDSLPPLLWKGFGPQPESSKFTMCICDVLFAFVYGSAQRVICWCLSKTS